jgi:hypothetical protein
MLHVACWQSQLEVLKGFDDLLDFFKVIVISQSNDFEDQPYYIQQLLDKHGFQLESFSTDHKELLYVKKA